MALAHLGQQVLLYVEQAAMAEGECKLRETSTNGGNDALNIHAPGFPKIMLLLKLVVRAVRLPLNLVSILFYISYFYYLQLTHCRILPTLYQESLKKLVV